MVNGLTTTKMGVSGKQKNTKMEKYKLYLIDDLSFCISLGYSGCYEEEWETKEGKKEKRGKEVEERGERGRKEKKDRKRRERKIKRRETIKRRENTPRRASAVDDRTFEIRLLSLEEPPLSHHQMPCISCVFCDAGKVVLPILGSCRIGASVSVGQIMGP